MDVQGLRRFPHYRYRDEGELERLLEAVKVLKLPPRRRIRPSRLPPELYLFLLKGEVSRADNRGRVERVTHRQRTALDPILDARFPNLVTLSRVRLLQVEESVVAAVPTASLPELVEFGDEAFDDWLDRLFKGPLLGEFTAEQLERLFRDLRPQQVEAGEVLLRAGEPGDVFYVLRTGCIRIVRDGITLHVVRAGGFFGEDALVCAKPRNATAIATEESVVLGLPADRFQALFRNQSAWPSQFAACLRRRGSSVVDPPDGRG